MKLVIIAVGRGMPPPVRALVADYRQRLVRLGGVEWIDVAEARRTVDDPAHLRLGLLAEAERIRRQIPPFSLLIPLDTAGRSLSSLQLAEHLAGWRQQSDPVCFVIGGPDGLHPDLLKGAAWSLSLGAMTFPHQLVRVLLLEQLYRAHTILQHIPYHR
ncbi:MAG: 23S rRNA (pseudouridine(1915)-N(3))-methyltransferase RlmH [Magnetococcus sp. DMHC-8]